MGSLEAMKKEAGQVFPGGRGERDQVVPEGSREGFLTVGSFLLHSAVDWWTESGMAIWGRRMFRSSKRRRGIRITSSGLRESHVHDVIITKEAPNYRLE